MRLLKFNTWMANSAVDDVLALVDSEPFDVVSLQETGESLRTAITRRTGRSLRGSYGLFRAAHDPA